MPSVLSITFASGLKTAEQVLIFKKITRFGERACLESHASRIFFLPGVESHVNHSDHGMVNFALVGKLKVHLE